jgi:WD40 repeat protein
MFVARQTKLLKIMDVLIESSLGGFQMKRLLLAALLATAAHAGPFTVGDVFASIGDGKVRVYDQNGTFIQQLDTGLGGFTTGSTFDQSGDFYVTAFSANKVAQFDPNGNLLNSAWSSGFGASNESIVFDKAGNAYIGYAGAPQIRKVDANGVQLASYTVNQNTDWIDLNADQKTLLYSAESSTMELWDASTNSGLGVFGTGTAPLFAKRYRPNGEVLVASGSGNVFRYSAGGTLIQTYPSGIGSVFALNLDPDGTSFWTGSTGGQAVEKIDIATGTVLKSWSTGTGQLFGLAVLGEIEAGGGGVGGTPEPSTYCLIATGLAAIVAFRRRRAV